MEMCTDRGHVAGMLDRDQRTAKMCNFDRRAVLVPDYQDSPDQSVVITRLHKTISHRFVLGRTSPHSSCKTRKNRHFWKSLHRLKHALIVGTYLSLVTFPSVLSAPTIRHSMSSSREDAEPKWLNPCGMGGGVNGATPEHRMPDDVLVSQIVHQAQIAEDKAKLLKEKYVRETFNMEVQQLHRYYENQDYDWLPTKTHIPKKLGDTLGPDQLQSLELKPTLLNVYSYLQKLAVGFEQMVWDETDREGAFESSFVDIENNLRLLLCEIYTAIIEKDLNVEQNVSRDVMPENIRKLENNTDINIRNWIIYRDYLNTLEYVIQVFNHFKLNLGQ